MQISPAVRPSHAGTSHTTTPMQCGSTQLGTTFSQSVSSLQVAAQVEPALFGALSDNTQDEDGHIPESGLMQHCSKQPVKGSHSTVGVPGHISGTPSASNMSSRRQPTCELRMPIILYSVTAFEPKSLEPKWLRTRFR